VLLAICGASLALGCGSDETYTPVCPELPRFDIQSSTERARPDVASARRSAVSAGCVTAPGAPVLGQGGDGAGGSGAGGSGAGGDDS
jgi:hypothetical protein